MRSIAFVVENLTTWGGSEKLITEILLHLVGLGYKINLYHMGILSEDRKNLITNNDLFKNIDILTYPHEGDYESFFNLIRLDIKRKDVGLILYHISWFYKGLTKLCVLNIPIVVTAHEGYFTKYSSSGDQPDYYDLRKMVERHKYFSLPNVYPAFMSITHAFIYKSFCPDIKNNMLRNVLYLPNFCNITRKPYRKSEPTSRLRVVSLVNYFSRVYNKGLDYLFKVIATSDPNKFEFTLLGEFDTNEVKKILYELYPEALNKSNLKLPGLIEDPESYYINNDVCLIPSRIEGFGMCAIEAATTGTPIIVCDQIGPNAEYPPHLEFNMDEGPQSALDKLELYRTYRGLWKEHSLASYNFSEYYAKSSILSYHTKVYNALLEGNFDTINLMLTEARDLFLNSPESYQKIIYHLTQYMETIFNNVYSVINDSVEDLWQISLQKVPELLRDYLDGRPKRKFIEDDNYELKS